MDDLTVIEVVDALRRDQGLEWPAGAPSAPAGDTAPDDRVADADFVVTHSDWRAAKADDFLNAAAAAMLNASAAAPRGRREIRALVQRIGNSAASQAAGDTRLAKALQVLEKLAASLQTTPAAATNRAASSHNGYSDTTAVATSQFAQVSAPLITELSSARHPLEAVVALRKFAPGLSALHAAMVLAEVGYPLAVPRKAAMRVVERLGLARRGTDTAEAQRHFHEATQRAARLAAAPASAIGRLFGDHGETVCRDEPNCPECCVQTMCPVAGIGVRQAAEPRHVSVKEWREDERPREKLTGGVEVSDAELLAIVLRTGTGKTSALDLARRILKEFGSLARLAAALPQDLQAIGGVGPAKAAEICAAIQLGQRVVASDDRSEHRRVTTSQDIYQRFHARFMNERVEYFYLLTLNARNAVTREIEISSGTLTGTLVHPREVFRHAIAESASGVIFVHNHPSGDPAPSAEDHALTRKLVESGKVLNIRVLDHVIIGADSHYSFRDNGEIG